MLTQAEASRYSPVRWLKEFLSFRLWIPLANISFTFYLWHTTFMGFVHFFKFSESMKDIEGCSEETLGKSIGVFIFDILVGFLITFLASMILYACFEKPIVDARKVF
jgi:peptidoglycan/LPS O-acetylase OafA/YrhL